MTLSCSGISKTSHSHTSDATNRIDNEEARLLRLGVGLAQTRPTSAANAEHSKRPMDSTVTDLTGTAFQLLPSLSSIFWLLSGRETED